VVAATLHRVCRPLKRAFNLGTIEDPRLKPIRANLRLAACRAVREGYEAELIRAEQRPMRRDSGDQEGSQGCERVLRATPGLRYRLKLCRISGTGSSATNEGYERLPVPLTRHETHDIPLPGVARKKRSHPWLPSLIRYRGIHSAIRNGEAFQPPLVATL
jgi:hypothetical protein